MESFLHLENGLLQIKGATRVVSSTTSQAVVEMGEKMIVASGSEIEVKKLDLDAGEVAFFGKFNAVKFSESKGAKGSLMKRIFK